MQLLIKKQITGSQREKISDELEDKIPPGAASITSVSPNKEGIINRLGISTGFVFVVFNINLTHGFLGAIAFVGISGSPLGVDASQKNTENAIPSSLRSKTPQCFHTQVFDFDTQSLGNRC